MSAEHRCECGQRVIVTTPWNGFAYVAVFRAPGSEQDIRQCPTCDAGLYQQLKAGRLVEVSTS